MVDKRVVPYWIGGWVIAKDSEVAEAAFEWARWSGDEYQDQMAAEQDWIPVKTSARDSDATTEGMPEGYRAVIDALADARIGDVYSENTQQIWVEVFEPGSPSCSKKIAIRPRSPPKWTRRRTSCSPDRSSASVHDAQPEMRRASPVGHAAATRLPRWSC